MAAQWGTPEYAAERQREQQLRDAQYRQQQENNARLARELQDRQAQEAKRNKEHWDRVAARAAGARGDTFSHHRHNDPMGYTLGALDGGRNPYTGKLYSEEINSSQPSEPLKSGNSTAGDAVALIAFFVGFFSSIVLAITRFDLTFLLVGFFISLAVSVALKLMIDKTPSHENNTKAKIGTQRESKEDAAKRIVNQAAKSAGEEIYNKIDKCLSDGRLELYLSKANAEDARELLSLMGSCSTAQTGSEPQSRHFSDHASALKSLKTRVKDGSLLVMLKDSSIDARKYRTAWNNTLRRVG
jgi:hypothetical protein